MHLSLVHICAAAAPIRVPSDVATNMLFILRWIHFLAGITWVGMGYFLVLAGMPWQRELQPAVRSQVGPPLLRRVLWWYRVASIVTVFVGIWMWMMEIGADRRAAGESSAGSVVWTFFVLWTLAYIVYMGVMMSPAAALRKGPILAVITAALVIGASYAFLRINSQGWETNRVLAIGVGGGIGWFMMFNFWGLIWRFQKRLIAWTAAGQMPPEAARMANLVALASLTNAWLSLPMLFFMAVASHYPMFGGLS